MQKKLNVGEHLRAVKNQGQTPDAETRGERKSGKSGRGEKRKKAGKRGGKQGRGKWKT